MKITIDIEDSVLIGYLQLWASCHSITVEEEVIKKLSEKMDDDTKKYLQYIQDTFDSDKN
jgi:hypothetical protein